MPELEINTHTSPHPPRLPPTPRPQQKRSAGGDWWRGKKGRAPGPGKPHCLSLWQGREGRQGGTRWGSLLLRLAEHHTGHQPQSPQGRCFPPPDVALRNHKQEQEVILPRGQCRDTCRYHCFTPTWKQTNLQANQTHKLDYGTGLCRRQVWLKSPHPKCICISCSSDKESRECNSALGSGASSCSRGFCCKTTEPSSWRHGNPVVRLSTMWRF